MSYVIPLSDHLAEDTVRQLEGAAKRRFDEAKSLIAKQHFLAAVYLYGYCVEMCLAAAYFRSAGFNPNTKIDRETRRLRMAKARQLRTPSGEPLMSSDPHPIVGWARFLEWQRSLNAGLSNVERQQLSDGIIKAEVVYKHWRPELRYKTTTVGPRQLDEVRKTASWFIERLGRL